MREELDSEFLAALKREIDSRGRGSQKWLAGATGIATQYVSEMIRGRRYGSESIRRKIASALGYTYEDFLALGRALLRGEEPPPRATGPQALSERLNVEVLLFGEWKEKPEVHPEDYYAAALVDGKIAAGPGRILSEGEWKSLVWIYAPALADRRHHDLIAVEVDPVNGDSMAPTIRPGDLVLIDRDDPKGDPALFVSGKIYAVRTGRDEGCAIKRVFAGKSSFVIASDNQPGNPPEIAWTDNLQELVIGRVVWQWRNLLEV